MNTYLRDGKRIPYVAPTAGASSGNLVAIRSGTSGFCGVVVADISANGTGEVATGGVHKLTKASGAITAGAVVYRNSSGQITTTATGNTLAGLAVAAATTSATTAEVLLNQNPV